MSRECSALTDVRKMRVNIFSIFVYPCKIYSISLLNTKLFIFLPKRFLIANSYHCVKSFNDITISFAKNIFLLTILS